MKHRTALVTAASIAAVIIAGVSAVGANVGILASAGSDGIGLATPTTAIALDSSPSVVSSRDPGESFAYEVPGVGVVNLQRTGDELDLVEVDAPGWTWTSSDDDGTVTVNFVQAETELVFRAIVSGDDIEVTVDERSSSASYDDEDEDDDDDDDDDDDEQDDD